MQTLLLFALGLFLIVWLAHVATKLEDIADSLRCLQKIEEALDKAEAAGRPLQNLNGLPARLDAVEKRLASIDKKLDFPNF